jgi:hypothetical protein
VRAELDRLERDLIELEEINAAIDEIRAYVGRGLEAAKEAKAIFSARLTHNSAQTRTLSLQ